MGMLRDYFINHYSRTDFHELNQDWIIRTLYDMIDQVENFVSQNAVKYADPIDWEITSSYEKNTIVIDPVHGVAYISAHAVPRGISLSNDYYWNVIFDLSRFITLASQNFANSYEATYTLTATMPTDEDKWIVWNSLLYRAKNDIHVGDAYVVDGNIERYTVEMFFDELATLIANETQARIDGDTALHGEIVDESVARENADDALRDNIDAESQAREDADNDLKDYIDTSIDNEADARNDAIDAEAQAREDADTAINERIDDLIADVGSLYIYATFSEAIASTKATTGSVIEIIGVNGKFYVSNSEPDNEHYFMLNSGLYAVYYPFDFVDFKAWNVDKSTDCSIKLQDAIMKAKYYRLPLQISGRYKLSAPVETYRSVKIQGTNGAMFDCTAYTVDQSPIMVIHGRDLEEPDSAYDNNTCPIVLENITFYGYDQDFVGFPPEGAFNPSNCLFVEAFHINFNNVVIRGFNRAVTNGNNCYAICFNDCRFFFNNVGFFLNGVDTTNSGGLVIANNCSFGNCRYGVYTRMWNCVYNNCNFNFNYRQVVSQESVGGITSTSQMFTNCEFEESENSYGHVFENLGTNYCNWTFNSCMFYLPANVDDGYFNLLSGGSQMRFKNSWIRTFGSVDNLRAPNKYLIHCVENRNLVEVDEVRSFVAGYDGDVFKLAKVENIVDTDCKGFTSSGASITYDNESITVANSGNDYAHATKNVKLGSVKGRYIKCCYRLTSSASGTRPFVRVILKNDSGEVLSTIQPSITVESGIPTNQTLSIELPPSCTNVDFDITTVNDTSGTSVTVSGLYAYKQL